MNALALLLLGAVGLLVSASDFVDVPHYKSFMLMQNVTVSPNPAISVTHNTTEITGKRQFVIVTVAAVPTPSNIDYLGQYIGDGVIDPRKQLPVQFIQLAGICPGYNTTGSCSATFRIVNMRQDIQYMLFKNLTAPVVLATGPILVNKIKDLPTNGHLGLHVDMKSIVVQWTSGSSDPQTVMWSTSPLLKKATLVKSTVSTYVAADMCGSPAIDVGFIDPGYMHMATIGYKKLKPNTRYTYKFGSMSAGYSAVFSFLSPPLPSSTANFTFLVFNDVGQAENLVYVNSVNAPSYSAYFQNSSKLNPQLVAKESNAQLALMIGDLSYAQGYGSDWDYWGDQFEGAFSQWPMVTGTGNHERDWPNTGDMFNNIAKDSGGECNVAHHNRFYTAARALHNDPRISYYSFNFASVHFLVLDSETNSSVGSMQNSFAAADLLSVNRTKTPWVVVTFHRPMYAPATDNRTYTGDIANEIRFQTDYEDLFYNAGVDAVFHGHQHAYARTCQVYKHECVPGAPIYFLAGHAGAGFTSGFPAAGIPNYYAFGKQYQSGYMRAVVSGTTLTVQMISTDNGSIQDSVVVTKATKI